MPFNAVVGKVEPFPEIEDASDDDAAGACVANVSQEQNAEAALPPLAGMPIGFDPELCCPVVMPAPITIFTAGLVTGYMLSVFLKKLL